MELQYLQCCGLAEVNGISVGRGEKNKIINLIDEVGGITGLRSGLIFTGAARSAGRPAAYASRLKTYIENNNLGVVHTLPSFVNKNTQRFITTYLWVVNVPDLTTWYRQNRPDENYGHDDD